MAYARTSAGPAGRPGACIFQIGAELPFLAISYLKIPPLIGRFYSEELKAMGVILMKMAVLLKGNALRPVENHDMESFHI